MADNGQRLIIILPEGSTKVRVSGPNEDGRTVEWNGVAGYWYRDNPFTDPKITNYYGAIPGNKWPSRAKGFPDPQDDGTDQAWWWKGTCQIWYNDSAGKTHTFSTNVPENMGEEDLWGADYQGNAQKLGKPPHSGHTVKKPPGKH